MARTIFIEHLPDESWKQLAQSFMEFCITQKQVAKGGFYEGDGNPSEIDGKTFASVAFPEHASDLTTYLSEWAAANGRELRHLNQKDEQAGAGRPATRSESK